MLDPRLQGLADVLVELVVRELEMETPSLRGKEDDGVEGHRSDDNTPAAVSSPH